MQYLSIFLALLIWISFILYNVIIIKIKNNISLLETKIVNLFNKRTYLVPSLYDITKEYLTKHNEVFYEIMKLRKQNFANYESDEFLEIIKTEIQIHNELNFIFKITNKSPKIQKNEKFLLIRDLFLDYSYLIWEEITTYKKLISIFNLLLNFKNFTIIWLFIKIDKKISI